MAALPNRAICHRPSFFLIDLLEWLHIVRLFVHVWPLAISVMYIERSMREAKDHHGSFTCSHAALVQQ
jgi:hypothetical protein